MPTHIPLVGGEYPGFRFLGLFPLSSSLPFPAIMTCVLDLQYIITGILIRIINFNGGLQSLTDCLVLIFLLD